MFCFVLFCLIRQKVERGVPLTPLKACCVPKLTTILFSRSFAGNTFLSTWKKIRVLFSFDIPANRLTDMHLFLAIILAKLIVLRRM